MSELRKQEEMSLKNLINHEVPKTRLTVQESQNNLCSEQTLISVQQCQEQVNNLIVLNVWPSFVSGNKHRGDVFRTFIHQSRFSENIDS